MRRFRIYGVQLLMLVGVVALATAQTSGGRQAWSSVGNGGPPQVAKHRECVGALADSLALTSEQMAELQALQAQTHEAARPLVEQSRGWKQQIDQALGAANPDRCAIGDLAIAAHKMHESFEAIHAGAEKKFLASLTGDQRAQYEALRASNQICAAFPTHRPGRIQSFHH